jgi:hypothetical protein
VYFEAGRTRGRMRVASPPMTPRLPMSCNTMRENVW